MRLDAEENYVHRAGVFEPLNNFRTDLEIAFGAQNAKAVRLHRAKMRAAREERHIFAGPVHACSQIAANGAGSGNQIFHFCPLANEAATAPRWIFPVAVRGIASTI